MEDGASELPSAANTAGSPSAGRETPDEAFQARVSQIGEMNSQIVHALPAALTERRWKPNLKPASCRNGAFGSFAEPGGTPMGIYRIGQ